MLSLFAGRSRRSSLANYLKQAGKIHKITVIVKEVDILQNKRKHDLTNGARRRHYMELIRKGSFDFVAASPPCNTFSRARGANTQGPRAVRSKLHPRGLPDLTWKENEELGKANVLVDFTAEALEAQLEINDSMALLEHPEDLGAGSRDEAPASIWEWISIRRLLTFKGTVTGAIRQSNWGTEYHKPTRLMGRLPGLAEILHEGWATFDDQGVYTGPLPKVDNTKRGLIGRAGGTFVTSGSAAWPELLCKFLADAAVKYLSDSMIPQAGGLKLDIEPGSGDTNETGGLKPTNRTPHPTSRTPHPTPHTPTTHTPLRREERRADEGRGLQGGWADDLGEDRRGAEHGHGGKGVQGETAKGGQEEEGHGE